MPRPARNRGDYSGAIQNPERVGMPARPFLWTLDQISILIDVPIEYLKLPGKYVHFEGRSIGFASRDQILARNIAPADEPPEWRVAERELIRWLKKKGFKYYDRGSLTH